MLLGGVYFQDGSLDYQSNARLRIVAIIQCMFEVDPSVIDENSVGWKINLNLLIIDERQT